MASPVSDSLLLPIETLNREFDGKLLVALAAAERGFKPIIGGRAAIHDSLPALPRSIYLSKGVRSGSRPIFSLLERFGHSIAAVDEEALVRFSDELFLMKLDPDAFPRVRILFAWGEDNAELWRRSQWYAGAPILASGNPRTDMMRPELRPFHQPEVDAIRAEFGDFALFNSNFSVVNHFIPNKTRFKVADWVTPEASDQFRSGMLAHKQALFERFLEAMPALARAIAPRQLVIRPHPSENADAWRQATAGIANATVLHEGAVVPWLIAARVLIHNGCSSAVEAAAIGTPALAYAPLASQEFDIWLPNALSHLCPDPGTLADATRQSLGGDAPPPGNEHKTLLHHHLAGLEGALCSERIAEGLIAHKGALAKAPGTDPIRWAGAWLKHRQRLHKRRRRDRAEAGAASTYIQHKFPGIEPDWIERRIQRFRSALGRFENIRPRQIRRDIFAIERR